MDAVKREPIKVGQHPDNKRLKIFHAPIHSFILVFPIVHVHRRHWPGDGFVPAQHLHTVWQLLQPHHALIDPEYGVVHEHGLGDFEALGELG